MTIAILLTLAALIALLAAEYDDYRLGILLSKPLASLGFLVAAVDAGALESDPASSGRYGAWVLAGLVLSWFGDVLLIPADRPAIFQAGLASFLLAHLAYCVAFAGLGLEPRVTVAVAALLILPMGVVLRWLRPSLSEGMRIPVYAYVGVITGMVACAAGASAQTGRLLVILAASMFYVSDLAVARDRFVAPGFGNRLWGLPLYYGAQLLLARSIAG